MTGLVLPIQGLRNQLQALGLGGPSSQQYCCICSLQLVLGTQHRCQRCCCCTDAMAAHLLVVRPLELLQHALPVDAAGARRDSRFKLLQPVVLQQKVLDVESHIADPQPVPHKLQRKRHSSAQPPQGSRPQSQSLPASCSMHQRRLQ
jgi:hypothetical protein